jgi:hypothetical protein
VGESNKAPLSDRATLGSRVRLSGGIYCLWLMDSFLWSGFGS